ncbi:MAG: glycosyltransferase [Clostridia bacterium]|nr:glycosyltransferase [Clostridia bacterium]
MDFSVSMCVYSGDNAEWFKTAIDSILDQTVKPDDIVLVVDGPVGEELDAVISEYERLPVLNCIRLPKNTGHGAARKTGLESTKNELVAIMDADDISINDRFEKQLELFKADGDLDVVGGNIAEFIGSKDNVVGKRTVPSDDASIKEYLKSRCPMNLVTVMFKKSSVQKVGGFIDWYCEEDYYLWVRMYLAKMKFANCDDVLVNVRVGDDMYARRGGFKYFKSEKKLQKYMLKNGVISRPVYFLNVVKRFIVQVLMPNKVRAFVFKKFARESEK